MKPDRADFPRTVGDARFSNIEALGPSFFCVKRRNLAFQRDSFFRQDFPDRFYRCRVNISLGEIVEKIIGSFKSELSKRLFLNFSETKNALKRYRKIQLRHYSIVALLDCLCKNTIAFIAIEPLIML